MMHRLYKTYNYPDFWLVNFYLWFIWKLNELDLGKKLQKFTQTYTWSLNLKKSNVKIFINIIWLTYIYPNFYN